jgi:hypothetical protein
LRSLTSTLRRQDVRAESKRGLLLFEAPSGKGKTTAEQREEKDNSPAALSGQAGYHPDRLAASAAAHERFRRCRTTVFPRKRLRRILT